MKLSNIIVAIAFVAVASVAPSVASAYGGGGGGVWTGGALTAPSIFTLTPVAPAVGQVLGEDTFRFEVNLHIGMRHSDVTELQNRLTAEGFYTGPISGYFGTLTRAAAQRYQSAHNITPVLGYVGPITRGVLNADTAGNGQQAAAGSALTDVQRAGLQSRINALMQLVSDLMAQIRN